MLREAYQSTTGDDFDATDLRELMDELIVFHAKSVVDGLDHNCRDWLTRYGGKHCASHLTAKMKEDSKHTTERKIYHRVSLSLLYLTWSIA